MLVIVSVMDARIDHLEADTLTEIHKFRFGVGLSGNGGQRALTTGDTGDTGVNRGLEESVWKLRFGLSGFSATKKQPRSGVT